MESTFLQQPNLQSKGYVHQRWKESKANSVMRCVITPLLYGMVGPVVSCWNCCPLFGKSLFLFLVFVHRWEHPSVTSALVLGHSLFALTMKQLRTQCLFWHHWNGSRENHVPYILIMMMNVPLFQNIFQICNAKSMSFSHFPIVHRRAAQTYKDYTDKKIKTNVGCLTTSRLNRAVEF